MKNFTDRILGEPARLIVRHPEFAGPVFKPVHTYGAVTDAEVLAFAAQELHLPAGYVDVYRAAA
ncbi:hypothetical protein ACGFZP_13115 [Kitasatospora sp. NPDC048239]|uniref:hypothetical protein n=1 Tax=Kitasatospora sp. NPDC048239 TaxID=3364046 RepID=UPI00371B0208